MARRRRARVNWCARWGGAAGFCLIALVYLGSSVAAQYRYWRLGTTQTQVEVDRGQVILSIDRIVDPNVSFIGPTRRTQAHTSWSAALRWSCFRSVTRGYTVARIAIPLWPLAAFSAVASIVGWARLDRGTPGSPCPSCNYDLSGLPPGSPCPECASRVND